MIPHPDFDSDTLDDSLNTNDPPRAANKAKTFKAPNNHIIKEMEEE